MPFIQLDTDQLRSAVSAAKSANQAIEEAMELLNKNIQTTEWDVGNMTAQLRAQTAQNRRDIQQMSENAEGFYHAIETAAQRFEETEQANIQRQQGVDGLISSVASTVVGGAGIPIASFGSISGALGNGGKN